LPGSTFGFSSDLGATTVFSLVRARSTVSDMTFGKVAHRRVAVASAGGL
jgi:hypothetical protein